MVLGMTVLAAFLRLHRLGEASFWLDEVLAWTSATSAAALRWWSWLLGFAHDHGPLFYLTQLATRFIESPEISARIIPALFGIVTIPLMWFAARRHDRIAALCAAALLVISPLHVYYSREARPYAMLMLFAAALLALMLRRGPFWGVAAVVIASLYTSATAAPLIAAATVTMFVAGTLSSDRNERHRDWTFALIAFIGTITVPLLYRGGEAAGAAITDPVRLSTAIFGEIARAFAVSTLPTPRGGNTTAGLLALALIGAIALARRDRRAGVIVIGMTLLPVSLALVSIIVFDHWWAVRYVSAGLPGYLLLVAVGIASIACWLVRAATRRRPRRHAETLAFALAAIAVAIITTQTLPAARRQPFRKLDWRLVASMIWNHARAGDVVITAEPWSQISLGFYLDRLPPRVKHVQASRADFAQSLVLEHGAAWLVTGGYSRDTAVRDWMCKYPVVLASPLEGLRVHYAPSTAHLLQSRSTPAEHRAVHAATGDGAFVLNMGREDDLFLVHGWFGPEDGKRWARGLNAVIAIPRRSPADRTIVITASPLTHPGLPPQRMKVSLNDSLIGEVTLAPGVPVYEIPAPASRWVDGVNTLLFDFSRTTAPASVSASTDSRELSAMFDSIAIIERGEQPAHARLVAPSITLGGGYLLQSPADGALRPRLDPASLDRAAVRALAGRLGFDPDLVWPMIERREVRLEEIAGSLAYSSVCDSDAAFARRAYALLLEQVPNAIEEKSLEQLLRERFSRWELIQHLVRKDEFTRKIVRLGSD